MLLEKKNFKKKTRVNVSDNLLLVMFADQERNASENNAKTPVAKRKADDDALKTPLSKIPKTVFQSVSVQSQRKRTNDLLDRDHKELLFAAERQALKNKDSAEAAILKELAAVPNKEHQNKIK